MSSTAELDAARARMIEVMRAAGRSPDWIKGACAAFDKYRSDHQQRKPQ